MKSFLTELDEAKAMPGLLNELSLEANAAAKAAGGVPSSDFIAKIMRDGVFSHSNRLVDGRNTVVVNATYGVLGDVRADNTIGSSHRDIRANAADIPKLKTLTTPYRVGDRVTNFLEALIEGRLASKEA